MLSNAGVTTPLTEFARVFKAEHCIEECLQRAKGEAGLADYQVRTWHGWHRHQTLALLATWFLTRETRRGKKIHPRADRAASADDDRPLVEWDVEVRSPRPNSPDDESPFEAERRRAALSLRRLTDSATYLYVDSKRYWYSTQPTVTRLADDRAGQLSDDQIGDEIIKRLREQARTRADFSKVHACVPSSDVPDEREARLVILGPEFLHSNRDEKSAARKEAATILDSRGSSPRNFKNTLVFWQATAIACGN